MPSSESSSSSNSVSSEPNTPEVPKKTSQASSSTPEASKKASKSAVEEQKESNTSGPSENESRSPSSSPEAPIKIADSPSAGPLEKASHSPSCSPDALHKALRTPTKEPKDRNRPEVLEKPSQSPSNSREAPKEKESKPLNSHTKSEKILAPTKGSNELQSASTSPSDPATPPKDQRNKRSFKSSLQVMLKRQEDELAKNVEFKQKLEKGELDEEEEEGDGGDGDRRGRGGGSEDGRVEEKGKETNKGAGKGEMKEQAKDESKKMIQKEDIKEEKKKNEEKKEKKSVGKKQGEQEERKLGEKLKLTQTGEGRSSEEKAINTEKQKEERKEAEKQTEERAKVTDKEQDDKTEEREKKEEIKKTDKEEGIKERTNREKKQEEKKERMEEKIMKDEKKMKSKEEEKVEKGKKKKKEETQEVVAGKEEKQTREEREASLMKKGMKEKKIHGSLYMKRKRTFNPWKEYYFVLDDLLLTFYRSQQQYDHLSGMKGSLDLSLVEEVHLRKPGLMKTHHPFCLARRNLSSIRLAAATKEDQQRWVHALSSAIRPHGHRLSSHSSDKTLHTASASTDDIAEPASKAATLPARVKNISSCSSSVTEEDDEEEEKKEVTKEEEPELIQPKKVLKVPVGVTMGMVNLGEVKLKKIEKREMKADHEGEKTTATPAATTTHNTTQGSPDSTPGELFGVVLKKTRRQEEEKEQETSKDTTTIRRPSKQPVIPLNSGKLLVVPEVKSPKTSPATQRRQTPERKKSPSPSLPISKSVQALTKAAEEVKETQLGVVSSEPSSSSSSSPSSSTTTLTSAIAGTGKVSGVKLCHAQTNEVRYINVEAMHEEEVVVEEQAASKNDVETEKKDVTKQENVEEVNVARRDLESEKDVTSKEDGEDAGVQEEGKDIEEEENLRKDTEAGGEEQDHKKDENVATKARPHGPRMDIGDEIKLDKELHDLKANEVVSETLAEDQQREDNTEEAATLPSKIHIAPTPLTPPASPSSSQATACSDKPSLTSTPDSSPSEARRHRANTNESTTSSNNEGNEKKPGKFQLLKKIKSSASQKEKEEPAGPKEPKKRRGSNAFSALLAGKKKNEGKNHTEEELHPYTSHGETTSVSPDAPHHTATAEPQHSVTASSEPPHADVSLPSGEGQARLNLQEADSVPHPPSENSLPAKMDRFLGGQPSPEDAATLHVTPAPSGEACRDIHSYLSVSSCDDQPPSIPEKKGIRAHSPNHDVPKSNRPVTNLHLMNMGDEEENGDEATQTVDGYITEEQIDALLNAKENKGKRRRSKDRPQMTLAVPDVVKGASLPAAAPVPSAEDWGLNRPAFNSFSSIDSDESLPVTNFLGTQRSSSSSGSLRAFRRSLEADGDEHTSLTASESGESVSPEAEVPAEPQRRAPRPTNAITAKNRLSLTSPEFTVKEEEGLSSPEIAKTRLLCRDNDDEDKRQQKIGNETKAETESSTMAEAEAEEKADSEAEQEDFFPLVGRDVQLRHPTVPVAAALDLPKNELRMSGIVSLKEYLKENEEEEDMEGIKSGISRLGHSAAVEKLKQASSEQ